MAKEPTREPGSMTLSNPAQKGSLQGQNSLPETTPVQLALDIFKSLEVEGKRVEESPQEIGFRKNNMFLEITGLGLSARRAIDVAYFIVAQPADENELYSRHAYTYSVDQSFFKWLMGTGSRNWRHLRSVLREAQAAAIEITESTGDTNLVYGHIENNSDGSPKPIEKGKRGKNTLSNDPPPNWGAVPLLGAVAIANGRVSFEVNPVLAKHIKRPRSSHFLSLRYVFRSLYGKNLYDLVVPHLDNETTPWFELEKLRNILGCEGKTYSQYKFLRQFVLLPAIAEVDSVTGIKLELQTHNLPKTRKIGYVRFAIERGEESAPDYNIELKEMFLTLRNEFAISRTQMDEILSRREEWTLAHIQDAIDYTRYMLRRGKVRISASGYLMKALRENYKLGTAQLEIDRMLEEEKAAKAKAESANPYATELPEGSVVPEHITPDARLKDIEEGREAYKEMSKAQQLELTMQFIKTPAARLAASRDNFEIEFLQGEELHQEIMANRGLLYEELMVYAAKHTSVRAKPTKAAKSAKTGKKNAD